VETWEIVARESIRDLVARYNAQADTGRFDGVLALFAPDAVLETDEKSYAGRAAIGGMFERAAVDMGGGSPGLVRHFTSTLQIDLNSPKRATARCYFQVLLPTGLDHWGRYVDEFAPFDGSWLFTRRRVTVDGMTPGGWAAGRGDRHAP
jgi:hypothetical protein